MKITTRVANGLALETLPRIGQSFRLDSAFENLRWYGRGPQECYADRKSSAFVGVYSKKVGGCTSITSAPVSAAAGRTPAGWKSPMRPGAACG